jgi:(R,R)-butanediol dehydrogenase / meso-butanediol dehydrogenase / diacetyl reductase
VLAARWQTDGEIRTAQVPDPEPAPGEALVEVSWCGICGSDLHAFRSGLGIGPGQILGHEASGHVLAAPGVDGIAAGDRVAIRPVLPCGRCRSCLRGEINLCEVPIMVGFGGTPGAMAERVLIPRAAVGDALLRIPEAIDLRSAALIEPLAVGLRAVRLAAPVPGDRGLVVGCGPIGLAAIHFLAGYGPATLVASDPSPLRRELALATGATVAVDPLSPDADAEIAAALGGAPGFDLAIECAGVSASIGDALRRVRRGGRIVAAALHGQKVPISLDRLVGGEVALLGSFAYRDELTRVRDLIATGEVAMERMITYEFPLDRVAEAFETQLRPQESVKVMLRIGATG